MKKMRRFAGLVLAMVMVFALAAPVFAAPADLAGHTYKAYQIFSGTQAENDTTGKLANVQWGEGINGEQFLTALKASTNFGETNPFADLTTAKEVADVISGWQDSSEEAKAFAKLAYANKKGEGIACEDGITTLGAGYYLVVDETSFGENTGDPVRNLALLQLTQKGTFEIQNKTSVPSVEKKVDDKNDSNTNEDSTEWQDSADYDIGDDVPFKLEATLADNVSDYYWYKIVFHDTLSEGLTYNADAKVFFGDTDVTGYFVIKEKAGELTISCNDVKAFGATDNSVITVLYTAELNEKANIGSEGNPNIVKLEFSNNPDWAPDADNDGTPDVPGTPDEPNTPPDNPPTGETPEDKVIVFTYKVVVNKVDENKEPLAGAGFTLYKKNAEGKYVAVGEEIKGEEKTQFVWVGLDDGDYKLVETTVPAGYNTIADIEFTITAEHEILSDDPALITLEGGNLFTGEVSTGALTTNVENKTGATLPETGGMGTTLFYVIGATLAIGAAVVMVTRKRMSAN